MTLSAYRKTAIVPITVSGTVIPDVVLSIDDQSGSTRWHWAIPRLGLYKFGHTMVDFRRDGDAEWWHKCDVDRDIKNSIAAALTKLAKAALQ